MLYYLIFQVLLILYNIYNARIDAYRILANKAIAHGINFAAYAGFTTGLILLFGIHGKEVILWAISAFFTRQIAFDVTLNLRRGLSWYYQSVAEPPKALMDRIERLIFDGASGQEITIAYGVQWAVCLLIKIFVYGN